MEYLHAYWRMDYIQAPKDSKNNLFSDIPKNKNDKEVHILWRGKYTYIVMNLFPYTGGHLLAIPYRQVPDLTELLPEEQVELMATIIIAQKILKQALHPDGFNIGFNLGKAAGAGIPNHLHAHIVPRWLGDSNFMPLIAQTRVVSSALDTMWERLYAVAQQFNLSS